MPERHTVTTRSSRATLIVMPTVRRSCTTRIPRQPSRAPNYDRKLVRRITLEDGTKLATLRDAANLLAERFATVKSWPLLEVAIGRLIVAAESSKRDTVKNATDSVERVLRTHRLP